MRRRLVDAGIRRMQLDTLRLLVVKIGARARQLLTTRYVFIWHQGIPANACGTRSTQRSPDVLVNDSG
jgi:hypothetical protein